jgi:uncharacterized membrane protein YphA (DoxX/SURF4 family)
VRGFGSGQGAKDKRTGVRASGEDAVQLVIDYFKQETLDPLRGLGRFMVFGITGSLAIATGVVLLLVAVLRVLQTETAAFHGNLSWIPYVIVIALALVVIALAVWRVTSGPGRRRLPES